MSQYNVLFVLGGPGAGKGTQCENIVSKFGYVHLSAGDLLRAERQRPGSEFGEEIEGHIRNGSIVPVQITCSLLRRAMESSGKKNFLIDGFPRNKDNLDGWNNAMSDVAEVKMVLFFNCSEEVCIQRCLSRGQTSGRSDDNLESLQKRIQTYVNSTKPVISHYNSLGLVCEIGGERSPDEKHVKLSLKNLLDLQTTDLIKTGPMAILVDSVQGLVLYLKTANGKKVSVVESENKVFCDVKAALEKLTMKQ